MLVTPTAIPDVLVLEPKVFGDDRGFFFESFNSKAFEQSSENSYRTTPSPPKTSCGASTIKFKIRNANLSVCRVRSSMLRSTGGVSLSGENKKQLWVPEGFAYGFVVLSETAEFLYKTTDYYAPEFERSLLWNDPVLGINWLFNGEPRLAAKDAAALCLFEAEVFA